MPNYVKFTASFKSLSIVQDPFNYCGELLSPVIFHVHCHLFLKYDIEITLHVICCLLFGLPGQCEGPHTV